MYHNYFESPNGEVEVVGFRNEERWIITQDKLGSIGIDFEELFCGEKGSIQAIRTLAPYVQSGVAASKQRALHEGWERNVGEAYENINHVEETLRVKLGLHMPPFCDIRLAVPNPDFREKLAPTYPAQPNWYGRPVVSVGKRPPRGYIPGKYIPFTQHELLIRNRDMLQQAGAAVVACCFNDYSR